MIDNETIKALECLTGFALKCRECPYSPRFKFPLCQQAVAKDALSLITRQNEEIDRYQSIFGQLVEKDGEVIGTIGEKKQSFIRSDIADLMRRAAVKTAEAEIEKIKSIYNSFEAELKSAKSEARREFAERLKENRHKMWEYDEAGFCTQSYVVEEKDIGNLLTEMESEKNNCI